MIADRLSAMFSARAANDENLATPAETDAGRSGLPPRVAVRRASGFWLLASGRATKEHPPC
jgi:hypothetical protein